MDSGSGTRLVLIDEEWGGREALTVMRHEGDERTASRQNVDPEITALVRPLAGGEDALLRLERSSSTKTAMACY